MHWCLILGGINFQTMLNAYHDRCKLHLDPFSFIKTTLYLDLLKIYIIFFDKTKIKIYILNKLISLLKEINK